ncbi:hypothetical protein [Streptomyces sp. TRM64462]|uniref:hypothetical protein n=1 Tax=Streptomyces sp. TRM64462 TaxID=2741726 RepID=UPI0015868A1C|nr:hypothetical protein [Streptomyces sp. TRM64462]
MTHDMGWGPPQGQGPPGPPSGPPNGPPPGPPPGPYGPYGYGPGGWAAAYAPPKPGVIPLGPLGVGDIIGGAFHTLGRAWKQLLGLSLIAFGVVALLVVGALTVGYLSFEEVLTDLFEGRREPDPDVVVPLIVTFVVIFVGAWLAMFVATSLLQAAGAVVLRGEAIGRSVPFGTVWRHAWSRVWAVLGVILITGLIALLPVLLLMVGFLATVMSVFVGMSGTEAFQPPTWVIPIALLGGLGGMVAAVWLWVKFSLASAAVVFENLGTIAALRRSSRLVHGDWWRVFGISLLAWLITAAISFVLELPIHMLNLLPAAAPPTLGPPSPEMILAYLTASFGFGLISQVLSQTVTALYPPLVSALLYVDRRIRTENLAPALAEAAGVEIPQPPLPYVPPQYGPHGPPGPHGPHGPYA